MRRATAGRDQVRGPEDVGIRRCGRVRAVLRSAARPARRRRRPRVAQVPAEQPVDARHRIYDYADRRCRTTSPDRSRPRRSFPCVSPGFDNSPRRPSRGHDHHRLDARAVRAMAPRGDRALPAVLGGGEPRLRQRVERVGRGQPPRALPPMGARISRGACASCRRPRQRSRSTRAAATRRCQARVDRPLPAAVPSDPRERRVVGAGLHRVDERRRGPAALPRPRPAEASRPISASTTCGSPRRGRRRPSSPRPTASRRSATGTTGSRGGDCSSARSSEVARERRARLPFCLAWANQSLDRRSGRATAAACSIEQTYPGPDDHERHFYAVLPAFRDPRYFRVDGRPLFFVYRPNELPEPARSPTSGAGSPTRGPPRPLSRRRDEGGMGAAASGFDADLRCRSTRPPGAGSTAPSRARTRRLAVAAPPRSRTTRSPRSSPVTLPHPRLPVVLSNWDNTPRSAPAGSC